jgi:phosphate-selective porin OprO/OprP
MKSFHVAAEAQKVWVNGTYTPAEQAAILLDQTTNTTPNGTALNGDPSFWGGYFEAGFYLTGETRAYKGGSFGRVKVLHPFNDGGWGAFQINGRVDYLNLNDDVDSGSTSLVAPFYVKGGKQVYSHINVRGGPRNSLSDDLTDPVNKREIDSDVVSMRAQIDF